MKHFILNILGSLGSGRKAAMGREHLLEETGNTVTEGSAGAVGAWREEGPLTLRKGYGDSGAQGVGGRIVQ